MARRKSVHQIYNQYRRILDENVRRNPSLSGVEGSRADRALAAFNSYVGNIGRSSASMQKRWNRDKQFSRSTYMGLNAG